MHPRDPNRRLEEDHDLLTYNESGARLREEIEATRLLIDRLEPRDPRSGARDEARRRLDLLTTKLRQLEVAAQEDVHAAGFLNYRGPGSTLAPRPEPPA